MTIETWLLFVALSIVPAFSPGPSLLLTLSNALRFGTLTTLWSALGNTIGMIVIGVAVTLGLGALMAASGTAFFVMKLIGGGYLIWLGIKTWRDRSSLPTGTAPSMPPKRHRIFLTALGVAITNPKAIAVQLAIIPPFLTSPQSLHQDGMLLAVTYAGMCLLSHLSVAILSGRLRQFVSSEKRMRYLRRVLGSTFMGFGAVLATSSH